MSVSIRAKILERMARHHWIGGKHTDIQNLRKGFERSKYAEVEEEINTLVREGFLLVKPTFYGTQVSLNPRMLCEIRRMLEL